MNVCQRKPRLKKKGVSKTTENEAKEQKVGFLSMKLVTLNATSLENLLAGKGINQAVQWTVFAGLDF